VIGSISLLISGQYFYRLRDVTTFTVYVTACDIIEKSSIFDTTIEIAGHVDFLIRV